jgi:S1-C subfamily serine protease
MRAAAVALLGCLALAGCATENVTDNPVAEAPPPEQPTISVPELTDVDPQARSLAAKKLPTLARDSAERRARRLTVRVRNTSCFGVGTGSGFAIDGDTLITNRHVLAGASELAVSTWDGRTLEVGSAAVGVLGDIGIVDVSGALPRPGRYGPVVEPGDVVTAVGYPLGGELKTSRGIAVDLVEGGRFNIPGRVLRMTADVLPGNSGGPVLDEEGRIVAVVFAIEIATGLALAIPIETMQELIRAGGYQDVPPCGHE